LTTERDIEFEVRKIMPGEIFGHQEVIDESERRLETPD
jgi:hypothetical protein